MNKNKFIWYKDIWFFKLIYLFREVFTILLYYVFWALYIIFLIYVLYHANDKVKEAIVAVYILYILSYGYIRFILHK